MFAMAKTLYGTIVEMVGLAVNGDSYWYRYLKALYTI
jgi:hypothetical protein